MWWEYKLNDIAYWNQLSKIKDNKQKFPLNKSAEPFHINNIINNQELSLKINQILFATISPKPERITEILFEQASPPADAVHH